VELDTDTKSRNDAKVTGMELGGDTNLARGRSRQIEHFRNGRYESGSELANA
jgi:hypothetical protein